jgi:pimeloyl-ACP methyl ester carboxylesterase
MFALSLAFPTELIQQYKQPIMHLKTENKYIDIPNGIKVFYREAGDPSKPVILLLHGFPSSSHQYRNLIPELSSSYHTIAPDLPGFGFTTVPEELNFEYTFANLTTTIISFLDAIKVSKFSVYIFDYGAPTALRLALQRPEAITAIISQNGNAYVEGLGDFWAPLKALWAATGAEESQIRETIRTSFLTLSGTKGQYTTGTSEDKLNTIAPESYFLDQSLMERPGNKDIQLDLFKDYRTNVDLYPQFQEYFRKSQVPLLAVWGKNDPIFIAPGAEKFKADLPNSVVDFVDGGHFSLETHTAEIAEKMMKFLKANGI